MVPQLPDPRGLPFEDVVLHGALALGVLVFVGMLVLVALDDPLVIGALVGTIVGGMFLIVVLGYMVTWLAEVFRS